MTGGRGRGGPGGPGRLTRTYRLALAVSSGLYLLVAGLLVYFLVGPYARVAGRLREQGTPLPAWVPVAFWAGTGLVVILFVLKAFRLFRRSRGD